MKRKLTTLIFPALLPLALSAGEDLTRYVDPLTGTGASTTPSALKFSHGTESLAQTVPITSVPNGMVMWTPQTRATEKKCVAPYYYADTALQGFRASHWLNGGCAADYGTFTIMPVSGALVCGAVERASAFSHDSEVCSPSFYSVRLDRYGITASMSGLSRSAVFGFDYGGEGERYLAVQINNDRGEGSIEIDPERREIRGHNPVARQYMMTGQPAGFSGHFVLSFDCDFEDFGTFDAAGIYEGEHRRADSPDIGAWVRVSSDRVTVRAGVSFTSMDKARENLAAEVGSRSLDEVRSEAARRWNDWLSRIELDGASDYQKRIFYTALYRTAHLPRLYSDHDGTYPAFSTGAPVRGDSGGYYDDFSMWDIYRATLPLYMILDPGKTNDFVTSLISKYEDGGWLPIMPLGNSYTSAMIGDHASALIADAWAKGIRDYDAHKAYEAMRRNAFESPGPDEYRAGKGRRALLSYLDHGFIPLEDEVPDAFHRREQVSRTLEYAYDDFAVSRLAASLGYEDDRRLLEARASNWRNVLDPATGWVRGRRSDGTWVTPFDPDVKAPFITEGTPKHYTWYVPHDIRGLIGAVGRERYVERLDSMFTAGYYWHGNEPGHQTAYMFNWAGEPWRTQRHVRQVMTEEYTDGPGGLCGNEDAGQMSAWYVFSALGFYPVCPGVPQYAIGSPVHPRAAIRLDNGKTFTVVANGVSTENIYIQSATLDGRSYDKSYITHDDILNGSTLVLTMGPVPNKAWASSPGSAPWSLSDPE